MPNTSIADKVIAFLQQEETDYAQASKLGEPALPILKDIIMSTDERLASKATYLASMIAGNNTDALQEAAKHPSVIVRIAAASASKDLSPEKAEAVLNHLVNDADVGVSKYTLQSIHSKNLSSKFKTQLKDISEKNPNELIKNLATHALKGAR
jgi:hypothetical protein